MPRPSRRKASAADVRRLAEQDKARRVADKYFDLETGSERGEDEHDPVDAGYRLDPPRRARASAARPTPPPPRVLTPKERLFVAEYLVDTNATQAAIRAGYSEKTAAAIGYENLRKPHIRKLIDAAMAERVARIGWDADRVLERLGDEVTADLSDLFAEDGTLKPVADWPLIWRQGLVAGIETEERSDAVGGVDGDLEFRPVTIRKIKLSDRVRRLELLGKHVAVGAFRDKVEHNVAEPLKQLYEQLIGKGIRPVDPAAPSALPAGPSAIRPRDPAA